MSALSTLTVTVISAGEKNERETKDADAPTISVAIGIEKLINSPDPSSASANSEVDALMLLVEQINDFFGPDTISLTNGMFVESEIVVLYDVNALLTENVFRGVVKVYYAVGPDPIP